MQTISADQAVTSERVPPRTVTPVTDAHRGAVSTLTAALVHGPRRPATVVASTRAGCYLLLGPADGISGHPDVLPVLTPDALALPTAVRLAYTCVGLGALEVGERAEVGRGRITASGLTITAVRTVRPARVRRVGSPHHQFPAIATKLRLRAQSQLIQQIGLGPGLTPEADDELAGHLLVGAALWWPAPDLEPHVHRTTALSASLLRAAAQGYAVPAVVAYVDAVVGPDPVAAARLRPQIEAIGHTSGPALLRGIHAALERFDSHPSNERTVA